MAQMDMNARDAYLRGLTEKQRMGFYEHQRMYETMRIYQAMQAGQIQAPSN